MQVLVFITPHEYYMILPALTISVASVTTGSVLYIYTTFLKYYYILLVALGYIIAPYLDR